MIDAKSRYAACRVLQHTRLDGRVIPYLERRLLPPLPEGEGPMAVFRDGERLDNLAARTVGDATRFWAVADLNGEMDPFRLPVPGRAVRVES